MNRHRSRRHGLLITIVALGAGLPLVAGAPGARSASAAAAETARYDPAAKFQITVTDVGGTREPSAGRQRSARVPDEIRRELQGGRR